MRPFVLFLGLIMFVGTAQSAELLPLSSGVIPPGYVPPLVYSMRPDMPSPLPQDFDFARGYKEYRLGENRYCAYFTQPMDPKARPDVTQRFYAEKEGWFWLDPGYEGACTCCWEGQKCSPEIRGNLVGQWKQYPFFKYYVSDSAAGLTIIKAELNLFECDSYTSDLTVFQAWDATIGSSEPGTDYASCCAIGQYRPYCTPTPPVPIYTFRSLAGSTQVGAPQNWYKWDFTTTAQFWVDHAPRGGTLILQGTSGATGFRRFSSSCNQQHPNYRPYVYLEYTK